MAIVGIGTDIVQIERIRVIWKRHPQRFPRRILSAAEYREASARPDPAPFIARRFAAKEAAVKALGTGFSDGIRFSDFSVTHTAAGRPLLQSSGRALAIMESMGIRNSHLSISDEIDFALAFVVFEG